MRFNNYTLAEGSEINNRTIESPTKGHSIRLKSAVTGTRWKDLAVTPSRCRTFEDFGKIPWLKKTTTFYNLGYPLYRDLCQHSRHLHQYHGSSRLINCDIHHTSAANSRSTRKRHEHLNRHISNSTKIGPMASTILVDPPCVDDGGASSGVFTLNALFNILFVRGYKVRMRNFSPSFNKTFHPEAVARATEDSMQWLAHLANPKIVASPFHNVTNYISFQGSFGVLYYMKPRQPEVSQIPHIRDFRWMIGYQKPSTHVFYQSAKHHCIGGNFFLGEGLYCSSSSVILVPMFPFHHNASLSPADPSERLKLKQNIVLVDNDAGDFNLKEIQQRLVKQGIKGTSQISRYLYIYIYDPSLMSFVLFLDVQVLLHKGRKRHDIPELYKRVKITLDCRNPGVEFINYESVLYDCLTLSCNSRATRNAFDYLVPSKYLVEPSNVTQLVSLLHELLVNYPKYIDDFKYFKQLSRTSQGFIEHQLDVHMFSRDVLFRTYCTSHLECSSVFPWALAIWVLYPMARIEVFTLMEIKQFELDNQIILQLHSRLFNDRYWKVIKWEADAWSYRYTTPVNAPPSYPCAYIAYMSPWLLPFGRDFANDHIKALDDILDERDYGPIEYRDHHGDVVIRFMRTTPPPVTSAGYKIVTASHPLSSVQGNLSISYLIHSNVRYLADKELIDCFGSHGIKAEKISQQALSDIPEATASTANGTTLTLDLLHICNINVGNHTFVPSRLLAIDAFYVPPVRLSDGNNTKSDGEIWLTSATPRIDVMDFAKQASPREMHILVQHLDPIIQSSFFRKAFEYFPEHIRRLLLPLSAVHYPEIVSLLDARHDRWGSSTGTAAFSRNNESMCIGI